MMRVPCVSPAPDRVFPILLSLLPPQITLHTSNQLILLPIGYQVKSKLPGSPHKAFRTVASVPSSRLCPPLSHPPRTCFFPYAHPLPHCLQVHPTSTSGLPVLGPRHHRHWNAPGHQICGPTLRPPCPALHQLVSAACRHPIPPPGHALSHFCAFAQNVSSLFNCQILILQLLLPGSRPGEAMLLLQAELPFFLCTHSSHPMSGSVTGLSDWLQGCLSSCRRMRGTHPPPALISRPAWFSP